MDLIDFILITVGYIFVSSAIFIFIPFSLYRVFIHIKLYGVKVKLKDNHIFKGENPILISVFEIILIAGGIYFLLFEGKLFRYIDNASQFLNSI